MSRRKRTNTQQPNFESHHTFKISVKEAEDSVNYKEDSDASSMGSGDTYIHTCTISNIVASCCTGIRCAESEIQSNTLSPFFSRLCPPYYRDFDYICWAQERV